MSTQPMKLEISLTLFCAVSIATTGIGIANSIAVLAALGGFMLGFGIAYLIVVVIAGRESRRA